ncbi:thioredoxin domain-containing protein [Pseudomonas putida]|uniref:Thioredoxin domain-containing protein n=1 Tax=Pseudomonas putida TaxID=303 RepID=A0AAW5HBC7_PSEPU|nr:thioredoxin domain-containing protein [Pseudomonas putida]MCO1619206.1 thioredoxin domain-containing protein [Pseudomonas putida]
MCWWLPLPFRSTADDGPQRIYGNPEARFTITLYADLECPHCQAYLPQLQRWIVTNDHVNLAWRHLPLPQHEPAASREARLVECLGQRESREGVWGAVLRVYLHTQGNGRGLAAGHDYPDIGPPLQHCLAGERAAQFVDTQKAQALENGFNTSPTLRLTDNHTQHTLILEDPIDPDALLSAVDLLSASEIFEMPADVISDCPGSPRRLGQGAALWCLYLNFVEGGGLRQNAFERKKAPKGLFSTTYRLRLKPVDLYLERETRLELATPTLARSCSTN